MNPTAMQIHALQKHDSEALNGDRWTAPKCGVCRKECGKKQWGSIIYNDEDGFDLIEGHVTCIRKHAKKPKVYTTPGNKIKAFKLQVERELQFMDDADDDEDMW